MPEKGLETRRAWKAWKGSSKAILLVFPPSKGFPFIIKFSDVSAVKQKEVDVHDDWGNGLVFFNNPGNFDERISWLRVSNIMDHHIFRSV